MSRQDNAIQNRLCPCRRFRRSHYFKGLTTDVFVHFRSHIQIEQFSAMRIWQPGRQINPNHCYGEKRESRDSRAIFPFDQQW